MFETQFYNVLSWFRTLQPIEKKIVLDILASELNNEPIECVYCGRKTRNPVWLSILPLCRRCHSQLFSPVVSPVYSRR